MRGGDPRGVRARASRSNAAAPAAAIREAYAREQGAKKGGRGRAQARFGDATNGGEHGAIAAEKPHRRTRRLQTREPRARMGEGACDHASTDARRP